MSMVASLQSGGPDLSVVITFHREDYLAAWTLDSVARARAHAAQKQATVELICVLDCADEATAAIVSGHSCLTQRDKVVRAAYGDLGSSRNEGVRNAGAPFVAIMDGDDYVSESWFSAGLSAARGETTSAVFHPEFVISFGATQTIHKTLDQRRESYDWRNLLTVNPWVSASLGSRDIYMAHPYRSTQARDSGFGYEDWDWNLDLIAAGVKHFTVADTALYYRRKQRSMLSDMTGHDCVIRPNRFFAPRRQASMLDGSVR